MPKFDFQERATATVKVRGVDQATATAQSAGVGPNSFPPPPPPPPPPPMTPRPFWDGADASGKVFIAFPRGVTYSGDPTGITFTRPAHATLTIQDGTGVSDLVLALNIGASPSNYTLVVAPGQLAFLAEDGSEIPPGSYLLLPA